MKRSMDQVSIRIGSVEKFMLIFSFLFVQSKLLEVDERSPLVLSGSRERRFTTRDPGGVNTAPAGAAVQPMPRHGPAHPSSTSCPDTSPAARSSSPKTVFSSGSEEHTSELQSLRHLVCRL